MRLIVHDLGPLTLEQARAYLRLADGDAVAAALALASDRNRLEALERAPDEVEVHHALFLLRRADGLDAPSFDDLHVALRARARAHRQSAVAAAAE